MAEEKEVRRGNRYPGLRPFETYEKSIFFGRNTEIEALLDSIKVNPTLILFSKSGLGKSSIINAGVVPEVSRDGYLPITIRFFSTSSAPLSMVTNEILEAVDIKDKSKSLVEIFEQWPVAQKPILIFDQFEEFFYHTAAAREQMIHELARLLKQNISKSDVPHGDCWRAPVKLLFLIRSDRLNLMNEISSKLPGIFNNRFELKPLLRAKAEQSIVLPAQIVSAGDNGRSFKMLPYEYSLDAIRVILDVLNDKDGEIESSQLQIVCQELEEIALAKVDPENPKEITIEKRDFKGEEGVRNILNGFYHKQLDKLRRDKVLDLTEEDLNNVKIIIEDELISGSKRIIQSEERIRACIERIKPGVDTIDGSGKVDFIIDALLDLRIIREEESHLGKVYEITHDTLIESIAASRDARKEVERERTIADQKKMLQEQQEKVELERERAEREASLKLKANAEREKAIVAEKEAIENYRSAVQSRKKARVFLGVALAAFVITLGFLSYATHQKSIATQERLTADSLRDAAENQRRIAEEKTIQANSEKARALEEEQKTQRANKSLHVANIMAEKSAREAKASQDSTEKINKRLNAQTTKLEEQTKKLEAKSKEADSARNEATNAKNQTASLNLALKSTLEDNLRERRHLALQAYFLNKEYNNGYWTPEIAGSLALADTSYSMERVYQAKSKTALLDVLEINNMILLITGAGEIRRVNSDHTQELMWFNRDFHYKPNSATHDTGDLTLMDWNNTSYTFAVDDNTIKLKGTKPVTPAPILQSRPPYFLTSKSVFEKRGETSTSIFNFREAQYGTIFDTDTSRHIVAAGTQNGWLYLTAFDTLQFERQYHDNNTSVNVVAFDRNGEYIATGGNDGKFRLNRILDIKNRLSIQISFGAWITSILFVKDHEVLVGTADGNLYSVNYAQDKLARNCCDMLLRDASNDLSTIRKCKELTR